MCFIFTQKSSDRKDKSSDRKDIAEGVSKFLGCMECDPERSGANSASWMRHWQPRRSEGVFGMAVH